MVAQCGFQTICFRGLNPTGNKSRLAEIHQGWFTLVEVAEDKTIKEKRGIG